MVLVAVFACLALLRGVASADAQTINVWLTTDDESSKMEPQVAVAFSTAHGGGNPVFVDETQVYQEIDGFGASFTDTAGYVLNQVAALSARNAAMNSLFTRFAGGIGLSFVRNPMGASDLARFIYSYDDLPPGETDTNLTQFSIAHDQADIIPLLQLALQFNPQLKIMATPWSPPGWMKDSGSMISGSLLPGMYASFAEYFVKYIQAYAAVGIPISYISLQNEPLYQPGDYPGMYMDAASQLVVLRDYVLPALASNSLPTKVLIYDHNWDRPDYPDTVLSDRALLASDRVAGVAWHGYGGTPGAMITLANKYPTKGNYETEHSGGAWVGDPVRSDFEEICHVMRCWGRTYVKWNLAADQNDGPHTGGCDSCSPLVMVNTNMGTISYTIDFYTLGHFSKFILPGAHRIYSANGAGIVSAAFMNPDGSKVLVAFNDTPNARTFQIQWGTRQADYSLPGFAGATLTWTGTQTGGCTVSATNLIQASSFNSVSGLQTEPTTDTLGGYDVGYADNYDYAEYRNVDFAAGMTNVSVRLACAGNGGTLEFRMDSPNGILIGSVNIPNTGGWQTWQTVSAPVSGASGKHSLYLVFRGTSGIGNVNWFQFSGNFNHPPSLAEIPDQTILATRTLVFANAASDPDVPPQTLNFHLLNAPAGASVNANSGIFTWRPLVSQSPSTQVVDVAVSDNGEPVLSATQSFLVRVARPIAPALNASSFSNGRFGFWISGDTGPDYTIQTSTNLLFWSSITTATSPVIPLNWVDTNSGAFSSRFYRVLIGP